MTEIYVNKRDERLDPPIPHYEVERLAKVFTGMSTAKQACFFNHVFAASSLWTDEDWITRVSSILKDRSLCAGGLMVLEEISSMVEVNDINYRYLKAKT